MMAKTRTQKLGDFGEDKALQLLKPRYDEIEKMPPGTPFFDLRARQRLSMVPFSRKDEKQA